MVSTKSSEWLDRLCKFVVIFSSSECLQFTFFLIPYGKYVVTETAVIYLSSHVPHNCNTSSGYHNLPLLLQSVDLQLHYLTGVIHVMSNIIPDDVDDAD
jgi:hypothetical protein